MTAHLQPPGDVTGHQNPRCYARSDNNCSPKISREHYISESLLRQIHLRNTAKVAGLKWQQPETFSIIPLGSMTSRILCERHNNALSPLDEAIGRFFEAIGEFDHALGPSNPNPTSVRRELSGSDIERWLLKCVVGLSVSGNVRSAVKPECAEILFGRTQWPEHWGLYFQNAAEQTVYHSNSLQVETQVASSYDMILAAKFAIRGLPFYLCLGLPSHPERLGTWRPESLTFASGSTEMILSFTWDGASHGDSVFLHRVGTYDGPPPNWKEWQKKG